MKSQYRRSEERKFEEAENAERKRERSVIIGKGETMGNEYETKDACEKK